MAIKVEDGGIADLENTDSLSCVALSRLLSYAAREAAAQNRFMAAELIQAAIAWLPEQTPVSNGAQTARQDNLPPLGNC
jgi:hypothetical protein